MFIYFIVKIGISIFTIQRNVSTSKIIYESCMPKLNLKVQELGLKRVKMWFKGSQKMSKARNGQQILVYSSQKHAKMLIKLSCEPTKPSVCSKSILIRGMI